MKAASSVDPNFAVVMEGLSTEAVPGNQVRRHSEIAAGISAALSALHSLGQRIEALEETVIRKFEPLNLDKIEKEVSAIRQSESVNHRLFDSLHHELQAYRDNLIRESLQKPFLRDLLVLFDDLSALVADANENAGNAKARPQEARLRDNLTNLLHYLVEILHRLEVSEMEPQERIDRSQHKVLEVEPASNEAEDGLIVRQVKCGFTWHGRVLRPAEVVIKKRP
jgi:molecular chaperone GrpE (heat shock protein)